MVLISIIIEHIIHLIGKVRLEVSYLMAIVWISLLRSNISQTIHTHTHTHTHFVLCMQWLKKRRKRALYEALEKIKSGLKSRKLGICAYIRIVFWFPRNWISLCVYLSQSLCYWDSCHCF
jgi:hypothetical protein